MFDTASKPLFSFKRDFLVILFFLLLTIAMTYPLSFHLATIVWGSGDSYQIAWSIAWDVHALKENPTQLFNANIFYPHKNTLAYSENHLGSAFLAWPIIALTNNPILAENILILFYFVLGAYFMYLLLFYHTHNWMASLLGGVIFGFNPYRFFHFSHLNLQVIFFFPLFILILHYLVNPVRKSGALYPADLSKKGINISSQSALRTRLSNGVKKQKVKYFIIFTFLFILLGYTSGYYFLMMLIVFFLYFIFYFFVFDKRFLNLRFLTKIILSFSIIGLAVFPVFYPYLQLQSETWYSPNLAMINAYSAKVIDYLSFSPLLREWLGYPNTMERMIYLGFTVVLLSIASVVFIVKRYRVEEKIIKAVGLYLFIGLVFFLLSFGRLIKFTPQDQGIVGPYLFFYSFVPGFDNIRSISRFFILVLFSLSSVIGIALGLYFNKLNKRRLSLGIFTLLLILIIGEYFWIPPFQRSFFEKVETGNAVPPVYRWLVEQKEDLVILELPMSYNLKLNGKYVYFSTYHWKKLVNGNSAYFPPTFTILEEKLQKIPQDDTIKILKEIGVDYVIVHLDYYAQAQEMVTAEQLADIKEMMLVKEFDNDLVYRLKEDS